MHATDRMAVTICRVTVAFVWLWHGLVPKLLGPDADELAMNLALGMSRETAVLVARVGGVTELLIGAAVLLLPRRRWPLQLTCVAMVTLLGYAAIAVPRLIGAAFTPVTINIAVFALAAVALILQREQTGVDS